VTDPAELFLQEAAELLEHLEQALLDLENLPSNKDDLINTAFRALHTLKGSGAMFGFDALSSFVHDFETAFDQVRKGRVPASHDLIAIALMAKDHIRMLIERPEEVDAQGGACILSELRRVLEASSESGAAVAAPVVTAPTPAVSEVQQAAEDSKIDLETASGTMWHLRFRFHENVLVNGTNPLLLLDELRALGPCSVKIGTDLVPLLPDLKPDVCYLTFDVRLRTEHPRAAIDDVFIFVIDEMDLSVEQETDEPALVPPALASEPERATVPKESVEAPRASVVPAPLVKAPAAVAPYPAAAPPLDLSGSQQPAKANAAPTRKDSSVRVPAERVDELMDRVGELVIAQARLSQLAGKAGDLDIKAVAEEIERLASGLRDVTMGIRMMPIGSLFGRFRRLVHDISHELGKSVELITHGEETELDKTMLDQLADPLVHLIRNSVDHGLEAGDERISAGKAEGGHIKLVARHAGAEVLISVIDDGRGLNTAKIRAKAEAQGLIPAGAIMTDSEIHQLIFHAGFSTADEVTKLSGRGVGMDVVKRNIEAMRGTIDIASRLGQGTEITLRLPLTLAIIEGLLVRVGNGRYVIPLSVVEECVELSAAQSTRSNGRNFMNIRGELVPFIRLRELFDAQTVADLHQKVVVVAAGEMRVGMVVDQIIGNHQTVIKTLSKLHADVASFSGATILGDGSVALILDVPHLVELGQTHEKSGRLKGKEAA
jgi:two-component system, chemotaxis family, sensor kinase CheA